MRVCFLTHYFPPEVGAPQTRIALLTRRLAATGVDVVVHTCFPHYPAGVIQPPYRNQLLLRERDDRVQIVRSAVYATANQGFGRRLANHASFALSSLLTSGTAGRVDVVVAESPPLFTAAAGALYAQAKRAAFVLHVADRWPASAVELGALRDRRAIAAASALERWIYRRADLILAPTEGIIAALEELDDARAKGRRVWPVVDLERFAIGSPDAHHRDGPLRLVYAGTVGLAHGLETLVEASRLAGPDIVQTTIAGDGADRARVASVAEHVGNVRMLGIVPGRQVPQLYADADAGAVLLRDLPVFAGAVPTKMLEVMAAGRPLLLSARGESVRLLEEAGAGMTVAAGDAGALAEAIRRLRSDPALRSSLGNAGRRYVEANFGAERSAREWGEHLRDAAERHAARGARQSRAATGSAVPGGRAAEGRRRVG